VVHHSAALTRESGEQALAEAVVSGEFRQMAPRLQALLEYAVALTIRLVTSSARTSSGCSKQGCPRAR
jgi:hypothetical protein